MENRTIHIAAAAIVNSCNQMLLVRKARTDAFMQPGGKIDAGETPAEALVRELKEELDLDIDIASLEPFGQYSAPAANETDMQVDARLFRLSHEGPFTANAEIEEVLWYPGEYRPELRLAPLTRDHVIPASGV